MIIERVRTNDRSAFPLRQGFSEVKLGLETKTQFTQAKKKHLKATTDDITLQEAREKKLKAFFLH